MTSVFQALSLSLSVGWVGENPGNEVVGSGLNFSLIEIKNNNNKSARMFHDELS